ncbi:hypothetical protein L3Y34_007730 [Caenorhabditis briggsae]|uniref:Protein containing ALS2cr12 (ALS2CR12) signature n=1 Tax=Caenorhabditis briggsae TaxID=6238 RepID=A0AAE9A121_CAEBR|nr:hypothetical protein L3Y34_007730 [Caenorhabditis briggsae]
MGWMKFLAVVPLVKEAFNAGLEIIDDIRSDPTRKIDALKKVSAESKQKHEEAMRKLKEGQEESEAAFRRREEAANERIRIQKEENDKVVNAKTEKIRINEEQHDVEMKKMNDEHSKKVLAMRSESKEARDKAEMEHRMKVDKMENEHKNEKREAEVELKKIKEEGQLKITQAEEEKDAVSKERNKELNLFIEASKELHEINQQQIREISKRNNEFRLENVKLKKEQLAVENKKKLEENHKIYENLMNVLTIENSRNIIKKFEVITTHVTPVYTSLKCIKDVCLPQHNEEPTIIPGELDEDFRSIRSAKNCFDYSQRMFRQYLINTNLTDRRLYDTCSKLITDMSNLMNADELLSICNNLPKAIDNDRLEVVKKYGKTADSLYNEFSTLRNSLENGFEQLQISHLPSAPSSQHRAIEQ